MRRRLLLPALAAFACACAFVVQSPGWAQTSYMALTRALDSGTAQIDRWHWQTHDVAYFDGHYYSVKPPGLVYATFPLYALLTEIGAERVAREARVRAESDGGTPWAARRLPIEQYGYSEQRAMQARAAIADDAPLTWALGLLGVVAPAVLMLLLVARFADRIAAGTGLAAALTLGAGTIVLPFSTLYFSHVLSAMLAFAAFALVWRERERAAPAGGDRAADADRSAASGGASARAAAAVTAPLRGRVLALAGLLAGFAVVCEYPLGIAALIVGLYVLSRRAPLRELAGRALAYGGGLAAGVAPLFAYHWWAFGDPLHMSYSNAVAKTGITGHDVLGLNDGGFFGITVPRLVDGLGLLVGGRGLLTLAPVLALAIAGIVVWLRSGARRAEARTVAAIGIVYLVYNAGYWLPFGGGSPGPRFLFPILPFVALGLAIAWRRWPAVTLALTIVSATHMVAATMSYPMIGVNDAGEWIRRMVDAQLFQHSVLDLAGVAHGAVAIAPFAVLVALALGLGIASLGRAHLARGARLAPAAVALWALCATVLPRPAQLPSEGALTLIAIAGLAGLLVVALVALPDRRRPRATDSDPTTPPSTLEFPAVQSA